MEPINGLLSPLNSVTRKKPLCPSYLPKRPSSHLACSFCIYAQSMECLKRKTQGCADRISYRSMPSRPRFFPFLLLASSPLATQLSACYVDSLHRQLPNKSMRELPGKFCIEDIHANFLSLIGYNDRISKELIFFLLSSIC